MPRARFEALAVGDAILDLVSPPIPFAGPGDRQYRVEGFARVPGGNATNFTLAFAALSGRIAFVGSLGRDAAGEFLRKAYRRHGVVARFRASSMPTGMTMAVTYADGTRHLITSTGANEDLRGADVPAAWIAAARHVHRAGYWWTPRLMGRPSARLLARAKEAGAETSLDIATDPEGWPLARRRSVLSVLPHIDVFFGNEVEVLSLTDRASLEDAAMFLLERGVREVVVHQASRGATLFDAQGSLSAPAFRVPAVNPTGCGDIFNAGYVLASLGGAPRPERLRLANAAAAWHLGHIDRPYPRWTDLRRRFGLRLPTPRAPASP